MSLLQVRLVELLVISFLVFALGHEHMMMAKQVGKTLHVCSGASVESLFYKGARMDPEMDWRKDGAVGFLAFEATAEELSVCFVRSSDLEVMKKFTLGKE